MRLLPLIFAVAFLSTGSVAPNTRAGEVKYKSHDRETSNRQEGVYKQPANTPRDDRPADRERPFKQRPDDPPSQPDNPSPPPPPPPYAGLLNPPCVPGYCPPPAWVEDTGADPDPGPTDTYVVERLGVNANAILSDEMARLQAQGFVGQVVAGYANRILFQRNYDWRRYDIGSVAESFTAWTVYQLIDAHRLSLDTTVGVLFPQSPPDKRDITVEQLLSHTSGLGNTRLADNEINHNIAVAKLLDQPLEHTPGASFTYSADGYVILAAAIEIVSARDYEMFLWESGVVSRDMTGTLFARQGGSALRQKEWGIRGAGGILSTAPDLFAWTSRFIQSPVMQRITQPRWWTDDNVGLGYGWSTIETGTGPALLQASGWVDTGDNVMVVVYPSGAILVVMSDRTYGGVPWSERVAGELEPLMQSLQPNGDVSGPGFSQAASLAR